MAQVVASPAQESKRQPEAQTRGRLQHEAASKPYCNPYPRKKVSGLGDEYQEHSDGQQRKPARGEQAQIFDQASAALRAIQSRCRKHGEAYERNGQHGDPVRRWRDVGAQIDPLCGPAYDDDDDRVRNAQKLNEGARVGLEQVARNAQHAVGFP